MSPRACRPDGSQRARGGRAGGARRPRRQRTRAAPGLCNTAFPRPCGSRRNPVRMPWHSRQESAKGCHKVVWTGRSWMNLQPLGDRLIVEVLDEEETTVSGIVLPDTAKEKPQRGRVLAVGPGSRDEDGEYIKMDLEEGDEIIFSKYGGTEIKLGTDEVLILRESDVLAKVVGDRELAGAKS